MADVAPEISLNPLEEEVVDLRHWYEITPGEAQLPASDTLVKGLDVDPEHIV